MNSSYILNPRLRGDDSMCLAVVFSFDNCQKSKNCVLFACFRSYNGEVAEWSKAADLSRYMAEGWLSGLKQQT